MASGKWTNIALLLLSVSMSSAAAQPVRTKHFQTLFPAWDGYLRNMMDSEDCRDHREQYFNVSNTNDQALFYNLTNCVLSEMDELRKTEMGINGIVLGLLPTTLQLFGPSTGEIAVLGTRRPLLAFMLCVAMPSLSTNGRMDNPIGEMKKHLEGVRSLKLISGRGVWVMMSILEYVLAAAAAYNVFSQVSQVAYRSTSVSAIAINGKPASLFLWLSLVYAVHILGMWSLFLRFWEDETVPVGVGLARGEWVPCARSRALGLKHRKEVSPLSVVVKYTADILSAVGFVYGTVALSSQIFISLRDVVPIVARLMTGALVCRAVLSFEIHGLWEAANPPTEESGSAESEHEMISGAGSEAARVVESSN
ncbi:hypothetical protein CSOJ01_15030 [Colletotrichum sojae]|uniref:Uncharacterized protein n=1 Tax=Colletotrichum sojae TaxID=2175907 RepID=A0A8H6MJF1_9PEZI|nr:hypothetical protein CSOJ01_15030 [Colletotrichum sojae]